MGDMFTVPSHGWFLWHCFSHSINSGCSSTWKEHRKDGGGTTIPNFFPCKLNLGIDFTPVLDEHDEGSSSKISSCIDIAIPELWMLQVCKVVSVSHESARHDF